MKNRVVIFSEGPLLRLLFDEALPLTSDRYPTTCFPILTLQLIHQIRTGNKLSVKKTMESSSAKRQRTKGKGIMEEEGGGEAELLASPTGSGPMAEMTCGICLSDVGRSIRGRIDSCDHHFCFVCIMEWSKVETRCPLCKQRFRAIRRPAVHGIFARERVVDLPERNQVYSTFGNESTTLFDPYANIMCSECQTATNEELLLLCDLCDSASHTYCVGLGATVPEGDWYCRDCTKVRDEHSRTQSDSDGCNQDSYNSLRAVQASQTRAPEPQIPVSISEIVLDRIVSNSSEGFSSEQAFEPQNLRQLRRNTTQRGSEDHVFSIRETAPSSEARGEQHVRTLRQCRNLQGRIRKIRENWNALRSGSLTFSSSFINSSNRDYNNERKNKVSSGISREPESISSLVVSKESAVASVSSKASHNSELQDVSKAWEMMEVAKSIEGNRKRTVPNISSNVSGKANSSKDVRDHNPSSFVSKGYNPPHVSAGHTTFKFVDKQHKCPVHEKAYIKKEMEVMKHFHGGPIKLPRLDIMETPSHKVDRVSAQESICCRKKATLQVVDEVLTVSKGHDAPNCRGSAAYSLSGQSNLLSNKPIVSSCGIVNSHNEKNSAVRAADKGFVNMNCSAKDEVQTLVKLNLKLQSKNQSLDTDRFKEVARVATHTILAACGLEHSKTSARMISGPTCKHPEQFRELRKSNLMPDSCRECFYSYVKHVVNSIFLEKTAPQKHVI